LPEGVRTDYRPGCLLSTPKRSDLEWAEYEAAACDVTIAFLGFTSLLEGEEGDAIASASVGDRADLALPEPQRELLQRLLDRGCKVIVVLASGSAVSLGDLDERVEAILWVGYPGQEGGRAVADLLLGHTVPSGKLPVTFYRDAADLPPFEDYRMQGRTHRYFEGTPGYPFGFGLSYSRFEFSDLRIGSVRRGQPLRGSVKVANRGPLAAREVVQVYLAAFEVDTEAPVPRENLVSFQSVELAHGGEREVAFTIPPARMRLVDAHGARTRQPRACDLFVGGSSPHERCVALGAPRGCRQRIVFEP